MSTRQRILLAMLACAIALISAACGPEDGRARGGGAGADGGNKPAVVVPKSKVFSAEHP